MTYLFNISRPEFEFWMAGKPDFQKNKNPEDGKPRIPLVRNTLSAIDSRLTTFESGDLLLSCIQTQTASGHTPGHIIYSVIDGSPSITNVVDVFHSPPSYCKTGLGNAMGY